MNLQTNSVESHHAFRPHLCHKCFCTFSPAGQHTVSSTVIQQSDFAQRALELTAKLVFASLLFQRGDIGADSLHQTKCFEGRNHQTKCFERKILKRTTRQISGVKHINTQARPSSQANLHDHRNPSPALRQCQKKLQASKECCWIPPA